MIQIKDKKDCCGCNACGDVCARHAISFKTDIEGFWYPEVDTSLCNNCGLCEKVCPIINVAELKKNDFDRPTCYAAEHKNIEVVFDSTSGGLFSALADIMYKDKGYVGGAIFNEDFSVRQYISNDKTDLPKLRSSKYLQSCFEGFYLQVRELLKAGEKVLVCGGPCQMAALRAFLRKDYDNLIIADYICRGINSPKVWRKYLDSFEERYGSKVIYCKAKSKEYGWRNLTQKVILEDGRHLYETKDQSNFTKGYLSTGVYCRPSCYDCKFKGFPRIADITLADFWGIENYNRQLEKNLGTSLVMVNSEKGRKFFERVKERIHLVQMDFDTILAGNQALVRPLSPPKVNRDSFFIDLDQLSFTQLAEKYIKPTTLSWLSRQKKKVKSVLSLIRLSIHFALHPCSFFRTLRLNTLRSIINSNYMLVTSHCVIQKSTDAKVSVTGKSVFGTKTLKDSKLESRLLLRGKSQMVIKDGVSIGYGSDVEVFDGARLEINEDFGSNIGTTIICGNKITIGKGVKVGRNVTIRDNNGGHYMNLPGYKDSKPIVIGNKVWLCEGCTIMSGVRIGDGAIIAAHSLVTSNVPAHTLVVGNPAVVVEKDVLWKY